METLFQATATLSQLSEIRQKVENYLRISDTPKPLIDDLVTCLDEAVTNLIKHGYGTAGGPIQINAEVTSHDVALEILDQTPPFDLTQLCVPDHVPLPLSDDPAGGFGIALIHRLSDHLEYEPDVDGWNRLTIRRLLS